MTKVWGPLGWMMVHSVSVCYPETPTEMDKHVASEFMEAFGRTITCEQCRNHYATLFETYKRNVPTWLNSRRDFFLAICRMHNNVNKRLDKPTPSTVAECISTLKMQQVIQVLPSSGKNILSIFFGIGIVIDIHHIIFMRYLKLKK